MKPTLIRGIISGLLLVTIPPVGLLVMWLIAPWSRMLKFSLTFLFLFPFILLIASFLI